LTAVGGLAANQRIGPGKDAAAMRTQEIGLSAARLARVDEVMTRRYVETGRLPGLLTMIYRRGKLAHLGMSGHIDIERSKRMREDAIFRIYSMSKPITSVALMMLAEEGLIGLDDDVATHIPSWKDLGVYATSVPSLLGTGPTAYVTTPPVRPMKVVDLVTHTSGLTYGFMNRTNVDAAYRRDGVTLRDTEGGLDTMIEQLSRLPLEFSPGTAWNYSVAIDVMGYLVQRLSGMRFSEFLRTRLFEPLGMTDTAFWCPPEKLDRFSSCYQPSGSGGITLQDDAGKSIYAAPPNLESGGGGLVSTAHDYMRFCRMMLHGGTLDGVQILSPKTVALFSLNHLVDNREVADMTMPGLFSEGGYAGVGFSIGCGVNINVAKTRLPGTVGEYFWGGAASTAFWIDPREELAVVFMTQVIGSDARLTLRRDLRTLVYSAMTESFA
jgi:CubicO group peptidase (beta-lactamase class C family)